MNYTAAQIIFLSSNLNRIDVVFTCPVGFVVLDQVARGLVYHRAEVKISSQT